MSTISADECEYIDMEWYGVDRQGNIAVFCSGGKGNLPKFVCENIERADALIDYFAEMGKNTSSILIFSQTKCVEQAAMDFSEKGLYYFDADDDTKPENCNFHEFYTKHAYPKKPLKYEQLPRYIKESLKNNFMEIENFSLVNTIHVKHAYT